MRLEEDMSTFAGKDMCSYPDQICRGRTKSASVICMPGPNLLALSVPPDQIRGRTDFTVTPATLKRLKRGDDNELERNLKLENVVNSEQLRLAMETEEDRRARLENDAATKLLS